ncbi:MAG: Nif3-like dinuclear metal center hexameric protein [Desulfosarcinaceae bacterium]|jgi:dinuclear metal center YbgI/SA1388 family protein
MATVADIITQMAVLAPPQLAEAWDNVGLQVGDRSRPVRRIMVALDPLPEVVGEACEAQIDLLITHHPLLMRPVKRVDFSTATGDIIAKCARHQLAIFAAHTNLDSALGGLNDQFADLLDLRERRPLIAAETPDQTKLVIFVPPEAEATVQEALFAAGAGEIGDYRHCAFRLEGRGSFRPGDTSRPYIGKAGRTESVAEVRLETVVPRRRLNAAVAAAEKVHPYETMAWDAYPLLPAGENRGLGRVGLLPAEMTLKRLAETAKAALGAKWVRVVGDRRLRISKVALCTGGGGSLLDAFFGSDAQAYLTGDVRYHDARSVEEAGKGLIDVGHFASERIMVSHLVSQLKARLSDCQPPVSILAATREEEPFFQI